MPIGKLYSLFFERKKKKKKKKPSEIGDAVDIGYGPGDTKKKFDDYAKRAREEYLKKRKRKKLIRPSLKLNPNHPTGRAILQRQKRLKKALEKY